jgi:hypothetical protein
VSECDESRQLAVGPGAPVDADPAHEPADASDDEVAPPPDGVDPPGPDAGAARRGDVVQAVADFVDALVEDGSAGDGASDDGAAQ